MTGNRHLEPEEMTKQEMKRAVELVSMTEECRTEREDDRADRRPEDLRRSVRDGCLAHPSPSFSRKSKTSSGCLVRLSSLSFFSCLQGGDKKTTTGISPRPTTETLQTSAEAHVLLLFQGSAVKWKCSRCQHLLTAASTDRCFPSAPH